MKGAAAGRSSRPADRIRANQAPSATNQKQTRVKTLVGTSTGKVAQLTRPANRQRSGSFDRSLLKDKNESVRKRSTSLERASQTSTPRSGIHNGVTFSSQVLEASINGTVTPRKICLLSPSPTGSTDSLCSIAEDATRSTMPQTTPLSRNAGGDNLKSRPPRQSRNGESKTKNGARRNLEDKKKGDTPTAASLWRKSGAADDSLLSTISRDSDSFMKAVEDSSIIGDNKDKMNETAASESSSGSSEEYHDASALALNGSGVVTKGVGDVVSSQKRRGRIESTSQSVTVAIRVRPFVAKELDNPSACRLVIGMDNTTTTVSTPDQHQGGPPHTAQAPWRGRYDYCFWSHSDSSVAGASFASQKCVYETLGQPLLNKAFEGYNTSLFAYGQTGSGKTYSMMGVPEDPGIIPRFAEDLFKRIETYTRHNTPSQYTQFEIKVSCYEIYNEKIYDLLRPNMPNEKAPALRVREHASTGPYVEGIVVRDVFSQEDIKVYIDIANKNRATAATAMNDRSSRSHAVFTIFLHQSKTENLDDLGEAISVKTSNVNLIDLAGSERADSSDTNGDRLKDPPVNRHLARCLHASNTSLSGSMTSCGLSLTSLASPCKCAVKSPARRSLVMRLATQTYEVKQNQLTLLEGASINKSLSTLGHVISALSKRESFIPYRNSVLTWLLKESLGGNAQTAMLFTVSPSAAHLETTMSTLRYASTTRNIVNVATVNEDPRGRIISELRDEVRHCRDAVRVLRDRLARAGLPYDDVCATPPPLAAQNRSKQISPSEDRVVTVNQDFSQPNVPKVCVSVSVGDSFSQLPGLSSSDLHATPSNGRMTSTVSRRNLADVEVNTSFVLSTPPSSKHNKLDQEEIERLNKEIRTQEDVIDELREKMELLSKELKMEKEAKDAKRRDLVLATEDAEREKTALRQRLMVAEAVIKKKTPSSGAQSPALASPSTSTAVSVKTPAPFASLINQIRNHTAAVKSATESGGVFPSFVTGKENVFNFSRMLTDASSPENSMPDFVKTELELRNKISEANRISRERQLHQIFSVSHMGGSTGDFCKVVKVETRSPSSSITSPSPTKALKAVHPMTTTTRLISLPEFDGELEKIRKPSSSSSPLTTNHRTPTIDVERDADTPSSYQSAQATDSNQSSAVSSPRTSDFTEVSTTFATETFEVTSCDITLVSNLS